MTDLQQDECIPAVDVQTVPNRKRWEKPLIIVSVARNTQAAVTNFTDGTSPTNNIQYGS